MPVQDPFEQMLQQRDKAAGLRSSVSFGIQQNPDAYARALRIAGPLGAKPQAVLEGGTNFENAGRMAQFDFDSFIRNTPRLASWASAPNNAAQSHDDLETLAVIEATRNQAGLYNLTPSQKAAVIEDRVRMFMANSSRNEANSALANVESGFASPFADLVRSAAHWAGALAGSAAEVGYWATSGQSLNQTAENIAKEWKAPARPGTLSGAVSNVTEGAKGYLQGYVKQGPSQTLLDPTTGKSFQNPDYAWWGRPLANMAETLPGTVGAFAVGGKAAPAAMAVNAGTAKYDEAVAAGANPFTAATEGLGSAGLNWILMTRLPAAIPTRTIGGAAAQSLGRGTALGLGVTAGENALTWLHDPSRGLFEGASHNILNMVGFEMVPVVSRMAEAAQASRLRTRNPEAFREVVRAMVDGSPVEDVRIPAEAVQTYFQSKGIDPARAMEEAGARNYLEAVAAGTDVIIPTEGYLTALADHHQGLAADLRVRPGDMTPRELDAWRAQGPEAEAQLREKAGAVEAEVQDPVFQAIKENVRRQLVEAGQDPSVAETEATRDARVWMTLGQRAGLNPQVLREAYGVRITRPAPGETGGIVDRAVARLAEADTEQTLYQSSGSIDEATGLPLNPDGTVTVYHHTSAGKAEAIRKSGFLKAEAESDVYVTTRKETDTGYGDTAVAVKVRPEKLILDDEFSNGRKDFRIETGRPGGRARVLFQPSKSPFADGQLRGPGDLPSFVEQHVLDVSKGEMIPNPTFNLGRMTSEGAALVAKFIPGVKADGPEVSVTGRALKHAYEQHPADFKEILPNLPEMLANPGLVMRNPSRADSAYLVYRRSGDLKYPLVIVELANENGHLAVVNAFKRDASKVEKQLRKEGVGALEGRNPVNRESLISSEAVGPQEQTPKLPDFQSPEGSNLPPETGPGKVDGTVLFQPGGGRYASSAEARSARAKRAGQNTQAAMDKARTEEHLANQAEFDAWDADVRQLVAGEVLGEGQDVPRGFIQFGNDGKVQIGLLEKANLSTFVHETGHLYVRVLEDLAAREGTPAQILEDLTALRKFAGAEGEAPLTREQQEKLARAHEAYLMEGKAPSEGLAAVFGRVKSWMQLVYQRLSGLGVKLNDEVRGVFDRIYATDAEIEAARAGLGDRPTFATAEEMGVTAAEFDSYVKKASKAIQAAKDELAARTIKEVQREREKWWKDERAKVREDVAAEIEGDAVYQAAAALAKGQLEDGTPIKLAKEALGKEDAKALRRYVGKEGMDADAAAEILGFRSGEALVEVLKVLEPKRDRIERMTDERMKAAHGDLTQPQAIADAAMEALHSDRRADVLALELRALRAQQKKEAPAKALRDAKDQARAEQFWARGVVAEVPPMETFQTAAKDLIESKAIKDLDSAYSFLVAQRKASREAFEALARKDYGAAAEAKQKELLSHWLYREALGAQEEVGKAYDFAKRFGKASVRERIAKAGAEEGQRVYLDQIDNILERFEFAKVSNAELARRQDLASFAVAVAGSGEMLELDPVLYTGQPKNYRELTLPELRAVRDALKNIETVARRQLEFIKDGKRIDFEEATRELVDSAYQNNKSKPLPLDPEARTRMDRIVSRAKKLNSELLKMEEIVDRLDGGDINGPWRRYVFEPMAEAQYREHELNQAITLKLAEAMESMPKEQRLSMGDAFEVEGLGRVTRKWALSIAMNMGNESNQAKLFKGMGWQSPDKVEAVSRALDRLNRADWEFVQKTWDALDSLWPEIEALELRMSGLAPERVQKRAFQVTLADGGKVDLQGGYYPVVYDPRSSGAGARQADVEIMKGEGGWSGPATSKGHTKERVEQAAHPFLLDFEQVLAKHTSRVVKDLSHREAAMAVAKLIRNQEVRTSVQETLGPEYEAQLLPWLKGTVNDVVAMNPELGSFLLRRRSNMVVAALAFKAATVVVQATDLGRVMVGEHAVKGRYMTEGLAQMSSRPIDLVREIRSLSPEMATRAENLDRDTRAMLKRMQGKDGALVKAQEIGMAGLAIADTITSHTAWWGAYKQALAEGHTQAEAVHMGDRVVRLKLQSGAAKDLTAIQRGGEFSKMITTYMGDAVATWGMLSHAAHDISQGRNLGRSAFTILMVGMIIPMLGDLLKNRGPQDDEDKAAWAAKKMFWSLPSSIPLVRDIAGAFESGNDYKFTPVETAIQKMVKFGRMAASDKEYEWDDWFTSGLDAMGTYFGLPGTGQATTTLRYLQEVQKGKRPAPDGPVDAVLEGTLGAAPKKKGGR